MSWLTEHQRLIGRCAWVAAWVGLVVGQLHALSRFATLEGAEDLALPATAAWAVPAAKALSPLLVGVMLILFIRQDLVPIVPRLNPVCVRDLQAAPSWAVGNLGLAGHADRIRAGLRRRLPGLLDTVDRQLQRAVPGGLDSDRARTSVNHGGVDRSRHHPPSTRFGAPAASPTARFGDSPSMVDLASHLPRQCGTPGDVRLRDPRASAGFGICGGRPAAEAPAG
jgi:hypothetical protein